MNLQRVIDTIVLSFDDLKFEISAKLSGNLVTLLLIVSVLTIGVATVFSFLPF